MPSKPKQIINMNVLPGELLDGTGRICIHLFVPDPNGPFVEPHALHPSSEDEDGMRKKQLIAKPTRGRLACNPKRLVIPITRGNVTTVTPRSDDPRAVTCPKCIASSFYKEKMKLLEETTQ